MIPPVNIKGEDILLMRNRIAGDSTAAGGSTILTPGRVWNAMEPLELYEKTGVGKDPSHQEYHGE